MISSEQYTPGRPNARIEKDGEQWTLVLERQLSHPPERVWQALTNKDELSAWAPYDADHSLDVLGPVTLTTVKAPQPHVTETEVTRADAPHLLEFKWGGGDIRWELEPTGSGTHLTLWAQIDRRYIAMGAAGWHICLDVMAHHLSGSEIDRIVGVDGLKFEGWQRLNKQYQKEFGIEAPTW